MPFEIETAGEKSNYRYYDGNGERQLTAYVRGRGEARRDVRRVLREVPV